MPESYRQIAHPFAPVWDEHSRVLVLGTFPSVKSRELGFYYGHPQNRFWRVLGAVFGEEPPLAVAQKRAMLLRRGVAVWDVLERCDILGSSDQSICGAVPNDIAGLLARAGMLRVYLNGQKAGALYHRYCEAACGVSGIILPSTSPANAAWTLERLQERWQVIGV
ncbi:MAG: DNA-deoxyinosine glycosylase [Clostridia bacterium]